MGMHHPPTKANSTEEGSSASHVYIFAKPGERKKVKKKKAPIFLFPSPIMFPWVSLGLNCFYFYFSRCLDKAFTS